jgi:hypothetical protein
MLRELSKILVSICLAVIAISCFFGFLLFLDARPDIRPFIFAIILVGIVSKIVYTLLFT